MIPSSPDEAQLDRLLTEPRPTLIEFIRGVASPLVIVGAGGKMGPTVEVLAKRADETAGVRVEVVAASRFSDGASRRRFEEQGVRTQRVDLLEPNSLSLFLPAKRKTKFPSVICSKFPQWGIRTPGNG